MEDSSPSVNFSMENDRVNNKNASSSSSLSKFLKTMCLNDWWLVKAAKEYDGKTLAVAGVPPRGPNQAARVLVSAPIVKRHDLSTLEAADGKIVFIRGSINKSRTIENGFCSEVFNHIWYGFPPDWEQCALRCFNPDQKGMENLSTASFLSSLNCGTPQRHEKAASTGADILGVKTI